MSMMADVMAIASMEEPVVTWNRLKWKSVYVQYSGPVLAVKHVSVSYLLAWLFVYMSSYWVRA